MLTMDTIAEVDDHGRLTVTTSQGLSPGLHRVVLIIDEATLSVDPAAPAWPDMAEFRASLGATPGRVDTIAAMRAEERP